MDTLLVIVATCMTILAAFFYNRNILKGTGKPNLSTWGIWILLQILGVITYYDMSQDFLKSMNSTINMLSTASVFCICLFKGKFSRLNTWDTIIFFIGVTIGLFWLANHNSAQANVLLQLSAGVGFIPTLRGIWRDNTLEIVKPWLFFSLGHGISILVVLVRWQGKIEELFCPVIQFLLNVMVVVLIAKRRSNR